MNFITEEEMKMINAKILSAFNDAALLLCLSTNSKKINVVWEDAC